jgi:hypothetical protein
MARKAQPRARSTTRPRRSSARIAQDRAGRGTERAPRKSSAAAAPKKAGKGAGRGTLLRRREARPEVRRGRFLLLVGFMAALGFTTVYLGDLAYTAITKLDVDGQGSTLWSKLVDRMLDRDIPTSERPAKALSPAVTKPPAPVQRAPVVEVKALPPAPKPKLEPLPRVALPKTPRADLPAPSPDEYARTLKEAPRLATREEAKEASRRRLDAILEKVGVDR